MRLFVFVLTLLGLANHAFGEAGETCSQKDGMAAEMEASTLSSWDAVYKSFKQFKRCDDGGVAEGYSESIVHLLASKWGDLTEAATLAKRDPEFRVFLLRHIDATTDTKELQKIEKFSKSSCDQQLSEFCNAIQASAKNAIKEIGEAVGNVR